MKFASIQRCTAALLVTAAAGQALAVDKSWNVANGSWNTPGNWLGGVPIATDNVLIGNTAPALNGFVLLNVNGSAASMTITDGMAMSTENARMVVNGLTSLSGQNQVGNFVYPSRIQVRDGANFVYDYVTDDLTASNHSEIELMDGGGLDVSGFLNLNDSTLVGSGKVRLTSNAAVAMRVDGSIQAGVDGLFITQEGSGRIDLDGSLADNRFINISAYRNDLSAFARLTITGDQLTDTYDEGIVICEGGYLDMEMSNGWAMGANSTLEFTSTPSEFAARVYGTDLSFDGEMLFIGSDTHGALYCPTTFQSNAHIDLGDDDILQVYGLTIVNGGVFDMTESSRIYFDGDITMHGGTFNCEPHGNPVYFYGDTTWAGDVTFNTAMQIGPAQVNDATTINAETFDMDGFDSITNWTLYDVLTINAGGINFLYNSFGGTMTNHGELIIHLDDPADSWIMEGTMNVYGPDQIAIMRFEGSPMDIRGDLNVHGGVGTYAPFIFNSGSTTTFADAQAWLHCGNDVRIRSGATFVGAGTLRADWGHHLTLDHQADMGQMFLINNDDMEINTDAPGSARIGRFLQLFDASWKIDVGGAGEGTLNDYLFVTRAGAELGGTVDVKLLDTGNGLFLPTIGQTFHILNARAGVTGTFSGTPTSVTPQGTLVQWSFIYTPTDVYLRCDSITERCPADFNHDGIVDFFDYLDFVAAFAAEDGISDFNHDGVIDFFDYLDFVSAFAAGC